MCQARECRSPTSLNFFVVKTLRAVTTCRYLPFKWTKVGKEDIRGVKPKDGQDAGIRKARGSNPAFSFHKEILGGSRKYISTLFHAPLLVTVLRDSIHRKKWQFAELKHSPLHVKFGYQTMKMCLP